MKTSELLEYGIQDVHLFFRSEDLKLEIVVDTEESWSPLVLAAALDDPVGLKLVLDLPPDCVFNHFSHASYRVQAFAQAACRSHHGIMTSLVRSGLENIPDIHGWTPLFYATAVGRFDLASQLITDMTDFYWQSWNGLSAWKVNQIQHGPERGLDWENRLFLIVNCGKSKAELERKDEAEAINSSSSLASIQVLLSPDGKLRLTVPISSLSWQEAILIQNLIYKSSLLINRLLMSTGRFISIIEPPLKPNARRIRWTCCCGYRLYDDFIELQAGALDTLERELNGGEVDSRRLCGGIFSLFLTLFSSLFFRRDHGGNRGKAQEIDNVSGTGLNPTFVDIKRDENGVKPLFLLMCINDISQTTRLYQKSMQNVRTDRALFNVLRKAYWSRRKQRWYNLPFRGLRGIHFTRVRRDNIRPPRLAKHSFH